jgi:hypothetical protein
MVNELLSSCRRRLGELIAAQKERVGIERHPPRAAPTAFDRVRGNQAGRPAGRAIRQVRADDQSENRENVQPHRTADDTCQVDDVIE